MTVKLQKKKSARWPKHLTLRISEDIKAMATEMGDHKFDVADPLRELVEPAIRELYKQFQKLNSAS
jgi:hypothetical protein